MRNDAGAWDMVFTQSETEMTTAATDALLGVLCLILAIQLVTTPVPALWQRNVWVAVLGLMSCGSLLGAVAHGLQLREATRATLWRPLYLSLGLAVALVLVAATYDWWGEAAARRALPWAVGAGLLFFVATEWLGGAFALFIVYEAAVTLAALGIYGMVAANGSTPGASLIAIGIGISLLASVVQVSSLSARLVVRFDHNGLFHLIQIAGIGVRASLKS